MSATAPTHSPLRREESLGLALAVLGHGALVAWLLLHRPAAQLPPPPARMEVMISDESAAVSTSPEPQAVPAPDKGPVIGEAPPPPAPEPLPVAKPEPAPPRPAPAPVPAPAAKAPVKPAAAKPVQAATKVPPRPAAKPGASDFDRNFAAGIPTAANGKSKNPPAAAASAQQKSSWTSLIGSKVRGPWNACSVQGLEVQSLRAAVHFTLGIDGTVASIDEPVISGITAANRPQVRPFRDCAVRAIKLAAPFTGLQPEFYNDWKSRNLTFRKAPGQ